MSTETSTDKKRTNAKKGKSNATNIEKRELKQAQIKENTNSSSSLINTDFLILSSVSV